MKRWEPIAYPGPENADGAATHRNFNQSTGERGSWIDADGYQQNVIDEPSNLVAHAGLNPDGSRSDQTTRAVRRGTLDYAVAGGTANALTVELSPTPLAGEIVDGFRLWVRITTTNTGAGTLDAGDGAVALQSPGGAALIAGDLVAGTVVPLVRRGATWRMAAFSINQVKAALPAYVEKSPTARALQTIAGSVVVEPTSTATVPLTAKGLAGQSAAIIEGYVDTTRRVAFSATGGLVLTGTGTSIDLEYPGSTWRMQASASNFEFYKNGTRITTFGIGVGVGSVYSAQIDCNNLNGMAIAVANIAQTFGAISFRTSAGNEIGSITVNPSSQTTQYNTTSDADLKIVEREAEYDPALLRRLKVVWYRWRAMPDGAPQRGALAQEVYLIWPEAVTVGRGKPSDEDFIAWSIDWSKLVPLLILEAQETDRRLAAIEAHIAGSTSKAPTAEAIRAAVERRVGLQDMPDDEREQKLAAAMAQSSWVDAKDVLRSQAEADRLWIEQAEAERTEREARQQAAFAAAEEARASEGGAIQAAGRDPAEGDRADLGQAFDTTSDQRLMSDD